MIGETEMRLRVTMDSSQARGEAERLHRELTRRYRPPTPADALRRAWDRQTGMPVNPMNPDLPYEPVRHSGIWWANQKGIKGLGGEQYRHQFFTEREARYMGLQFAKAANKELTQSAKHFGYSLASVLLASGVSTYTNYLSMPGRNNRTNEVVGSYASGIGGGALAGGLTGFMVGGPWGAGIGAVIGGIGGSFQGVNTQIGHRNQDIAEDQRFYMEQMMRRRSHSFGMSDWALQAQMGMMPSRSGKLELLAKQLNDIQNGRGSETISKIERERSVMMRGGEYNGQHYEKGDWLTTEDGQRQQAILNALYARRESLNLQYMQTKYSMPHARPMDAITDEYSRRGLSVGGQVNVQQTNSVIVDKMRVIIGLLESVRKNTTNQKRDVIYNEFQW